MRASKGVLPFVVSIGLILAVTAILWQLRLAAHSSLHLVYIYLFPVTLIAALYNGRLAVLSTQHPAQLSAQASSKPTQVAPPQSLLPPKQ